MSIFSHTKFLITAFVVVFAANSALAQVPNSVDPGRVDKRNRELEKPAVSPEPLVKGEENRVRGSTDNTVQFELKSISFEGLSDYNEARLKPIYQSYIGEKVTLSSLQDLADEITKELRNDGFVLTRAIVPSQRVENGHVKIKVVGGKISKVSIEGDIKGRSGLLEDYANKIKNMQPVNFKTIERYLLLMDDLPGVTAKGVLRPGAAGASELVIKVSHDYVDGGVSADNRGGKFLGPVQGTAFAKFNSILGLYEQTAVRTNITAEPEELKYFEVAHQEQLGSEGTKMDISASYTKTNPGSSLKALDIEGSSTSYNIAVSHPFIRSRSQNLFTDLSFNWRNTESESPFAFSYKDHVRAVRAGATFDFVDPLDGINRLDARASKGLDIDTPSIATAPSRAGAEQEFRKVEGSFSHLRNIYGPVSAEVRVSGQYSRDSLFASEEFGIGGINFGSAYDSFEISGDQGVAARGELQFNQGLEERAYIESYQVYGFYDGGKVWNNDVIIGESSDAGLTSTGFGVRFNGAYDVTGSLEAAFPISRTVQSEGDKDPRFFFNLAYRF